MIFSACSKRKKFGSIYGRGIGAEIGAFHSAWPVSENAMVTYIDRFSREELVRQYPEISPDSIPETGLIDDGRFLLKVEKNSLDFLVASHVLEHSDNPLATLDCWLSRLRPGGFLLLAVPDKEMTFDKPRPNTTFYDVAMAYRGCREFKRAQLVEYFSLVNNLSGEALDAQVKKSLDGDEHIHFVAWSGQAFREFLERAKEEIPSRYEILEFEQNGSESLAVLKRL